MDTENLHLMLGEVKPNEFVFKTADFDFKDVEVNEVAFDVNIVDVEEVKNENDRWVKITFERPVKRICARVFEKGGEYVEEIKLPPNVDEIHNCTFLDCYNLRELHIGKYTKYIGECAFSARSLEHVSVDEDNKVYDSRENCNAIIETESNTVILGCKNTVFVEGIRIIGYCSFQDCVGLSYIELPEGVYMICSGAFSGCGELTDVILPKTLGTIESLSFDGCEIKHIVVKNTRAWFSDVTLLAALKEMRSSVYSHNDEGCDVNNDVVVKNEDETQNDEVSEDPKTDEKMFNFTDFEKKFYEGYVMFIKTTEKLDIWGIIVNENAFGVGYKITDIEYNEDTEQYAIIFNKSVGAIGDDVFTVTYPNGKKFTINDKVTSVILPNTTTCIMGTAFYDCTELREVFIPKDVYYIHPEFAFRSFNLERIVVDSRNDVYDSRFNCNAVIDKIHNKLVLGCVNTKIPMGVVIIGEHAFEKCSRLTEIDFPKGIEKIESYAFCDCKLEDIKLPKSVEYIGPMCFFGNDVESILMPEDVECGDAAIYCDNVNYI